MGARAAGFRRLVGAFHLKSLNASRKPCIIPQLKVFTKLSSCKARRSWRFVIYFFSPVDKFLIKRLNKRLKCLLSTHWLKIEYAAATDHTRRFARCRSCAVAGLRGPIGARIARTTVQYLDKTAECQLIRRFLAHPYRSGQSFQIGLDPRPIRRSSVCAFAANLWPTYTN